LGWKVFAGFGTGIFVAGIVVHFDFALFVLLMDMDG